MTGVKNRYHSHFLTPCKIYRRVGEMSGSILRVQPSTKPLLYFWCVCDDAQPYKRDWRLSACQEIKKKHGSEIEAFRLYVGRIKISN